VCVYSKALRIILLLFNRTDGRSLDGAAPPTPPPYGHGRTLIIQNDIIYVYIVVCHTTPTNNNNTYYIICARPEFRHTRTLQSVRLSDRILCSSHVHDARSANMCTPCTSVDYVCTTPYTAVVVVAYTCSYVHSAGGGRSLHHASSAAPYWPE